VSDIRLRPRSATETVDAAFQLYRRDPVPYIVVTAVTYVPWLIVQLFWLGKTPAEQIARMMSWSGFATGLGTWVSFSLMSAILIRVGSDAYVSGSTDVGTAVNAVLPRVPSLIAAALLKSIVVMVGFVLLIVPGFYAIARFFAVDSAIVLEGRSVGAAFGRSSKLSAGRKRHVLATLFLAGLVIFILSAAVGLFAGVFGSQVIQMVLSNALTIVVYPLVGITEMLLYYDARIRDEGFDIEVMESRLAEPA
jgi:hypothetical protein